MLLPRFSLRTLLGVMTASSFLFLVLAYAVRGETWAIAVFAAIGSLAVCGVIYIALFMAVWLYAQLRGAGRPQRPHSPFAASRPPPQIVRPENPE